MNKKQNIEIDSPASSGGEGKYNDSFPLPPLDAALSIPKREFFFFFAKKKFLGIDKKDVDINGQL